MLVPVSPWFLCAGPGKRFMRIGKRAALVLDLLISMREPTHDIR